MHVSSLISTYLLSILFLLPSLEGASHSTPPTLEGTITATPLSSTEINNNKVLPGSVVNLSVKVKNTGRYPTQPGTIFIRFGFPEPLDELPSSVLFETEELVLPSIPPFEERTLTFSKPHKWPSLFDYVRNDWAMREYEAIVSQGKKTHKIGQKALLVSAYYYLHRTE